MKLRLTFASLVTIGCSLHGNEPQNIAVASQNGLGVTALEVSRSVQEDGNVFEIVGFAGT
jgi:hypothetical protein